MVILNFNLMVKCYFHFYQPKPDFWLGFYHLNRRYCSCHYLWEDHTKNSSEVAVKMYSGYSLLYPDKFSKRSAFSYLEPKAFACCRGFDIGYWNAFNWSFPTCLGCVPASPYSICFMCCQSPTPAGPDDLLSSTNVLIAAATRTAISWQCRRAWAPSCWVLCRSVGKRYCDLRFELCQFDSFNCALHSDKSPFAFNFDFNQLLLGLLSW